MRIPRHLPALIVMVSWLMFILAFFLPVTNVFGAGGTGPGAPLTGWQTFTSSLEILGYPPAIFLLIEQPRLLVVLLFPFINLAMLLAPVVVLAWADSWLLSGLFLCSGLLPWALPRDATGNLFVGFYLWDMSFFMMTLGCILASTCRKQIYEGNARPNTGAIGG